MAGISSKALNGAIPNRNKFNGGNELQSVEFSDGSGLELYDAVNRGYDPQIGRFWQVDELAEAYWEESVYSFAHNDPILFNDPFGLTPVDPAENGGKPKDLETVVVTGYSTKAKIRIYWQLVNTDTDFKRVS
jgi:RHS repeat-associated protein